MGWINILKIILMTILRVGVENDRKLLLEGRGDGGEVE